MARSDFAGTTNDFLFKSTPFMRLTSGTLTFWSAASGGTQYTDLLLDGSPVTSITVDSSGFIPTFQGPDGVTSMYADEGAVGGARIRMATPTGPQGPAGSVSSITDNGDGTATLVATLTDNNDGTVTL